MTEFIPRLPAAPRPPHDPLHYLLNHDAGWRTGKLEKVEESPDGALQLAPNETRLGRPLADDAGTFGGLALPTGAAMDCVGNLLLLDSETGQLKLFDPCDCLFKPLACTGGLGSEPRKLRAPHGLAIWGSDVFVCDTGNQRVQVFALRGLVLRAIWASPVAANLPQSWAPFDIVFDARGRAFVSDSANGVIHRFDRHGRWQQAFGPLNVPTHLAIDRQDRIYVVEKDHSDVAVFDADDAALDRVSRADKISGDFCLIGFVVDAQGKLYLGDWCVPAPSTAAGTCAPKSDDRVRGVFDLHGNPARVKQRDLAAWLGPKVSYEAEGAYLSLPLDSEMYRCQWHRVVLEGEIPSGASVEVHTLTTETEYDPADLPEATDRAWRTDQKATALNGGSWDCLIRSQPGRFLYLRLTFKSNGAVTPLTNR